MCVHEKVLTAGRNAVVGLMKHFGTDNAVLSVTADGYDLLIYKTEQLFCPWCVENKDLGDFLIYVSAYVKDYVSEDDDIVWDDPKVYYSSEE